MNGTDRELDGKSRGQSIVELAMTMPILLMLVMGVIDLSFVLYASVHVAAAASEGARSGSAYPGDLTLTLAQNDAARLQIVQNAVYNPVTGTTALGLLKATSPNFNVGTDVQVTYPSAPSGVTREGDDLVVTVNYRQTLWFNFLPGAISGMLPLSTSIRMRIE